MKKLVKKLQLKMRKDLFQPTLLEQLELKRELINRIERKKDLLGSVESEYRIY